MTSYQQKGFSYHILRDFGNDNFLTWWPNCDFGNYCNDLEIAKEVFKKEILKDTLTNFKLVSYQAMVNESNEIIGVVHGTEEILDQ